jgi:hypothetical protein
MRDLRFSLRPLARRRNCRRSSCLLRGGIVLIRRRSRGVHDQIPELSRNLKSEEG